MQTSQSFYLSTSQKPKREAKAKATGGLKKNIACDRRDNDEGTADARKEKAREENEIREQYREAGLI